MSYLKKILHINQTKKQRNQEIIEVQKQQDLLDQAIEKAKRTSGIDYRKILTGDEKEVQRLRMKQHQERMNLYNDK